MVMSARVNNTENLKKAFSDYEQKKAALLKSYQELYATESSVSLGKDTSNLFRDRIVAQKKLDVKQFNKVLHVDPVHLIAEIEGMTTYETIVTETLKYGCLPTVVPELKSITIGGALAGVAIESSSFRYGLVHETITEYEVLLGNGQIVTCTANNEYRDLFYAFPNSYGTLGYALKVKVQLVRVAPFVKLTHIHFTNANDYFEWLEKTCLNNRGSDAPITYIEGVVFDQHNFYATIGEFVEYAPFLSNYKYLNIYYQSIKKVKTDYLTTSDYIYRWDSDWFWCSKNFFMQNFIMRLLFGKFILKSISFWKIRNFIAQHRWARKLLNVFQGKTESVIQDVQIPIKDATHFLDFFNNKIKILPIWICPVMSYHPEPYTFYKLDPKVLYINFGFWEAIKSQKEEGFYNKLIEKKVTELNGHKSLYSKVYYTPKEFWEIYDKNLYDQLKIKYDPNKKLKNIFTKIQ